MTPMKLFLSGPSLFSTDRSEPVKAKDAERAKRQLLTSILDDLSFWEATPVKSCIVEEENEAEIDEESPEHDDVQDAAAAIDIAQEPQQADEEEDAEDVEAALDKESEDALFEQALSIMKAKSEDSAGSSDSTYPEPQWKSTVDPVTGRTYYYHLVTRQTQWEKVSVFLGGSGICRCL
jgi:WW domain